MLAFWGDNEALTARKSADYTIPLKRLRYTLIEQSVILNNQSLMRHYYSNIAVT